MNKSLKKELLHIPHFSITDSIPMRSISEDGIIEVRKGLYSKTYKMQDINFNLAKLEDKVDIYMNWREALSSFDIDNRVQITIINRILESDSMMKDVLLQEAGDGYDDFREEYNEIIRDNVHKEKNVLREKYITITEEKDSLEDAINEYNSVEENIFSPLEKMHVYLNSLDRTERLTLLRSLYNPDSDQDIEEISVNGEAISAFNLNNLYGQGLDIKTYVAPSSMEFFSNYFKIGDKFGACLSVLSYPSAIPDKFLTELSERKFDCIVSFNLKKIDKATSYKMVKNKLLNIEGDAAAMQSKTFFIPYTTKRDLDNTEEMLDDLSSRDQDLWEVQFHITVFANTLTEVKKHIDTIRDRCRSKGVGCQRASTNVEQVFNSCLPFGQDQSGRKRTLTTEAIAGFIPFSAQDLRQKLSGIYRPQYFGINKATKSLISYSRSSGDSYNMLRLGFTGSGKSMFTKFQQLSNFLLDPGADIICIDPMGEYGTLCKALGGQVIHITGSGKDRINPFDINNLYSISDNVDPIANKIDFITSMVSVMFGSHTILSSLQQTEITQAGKKIFDEWKYSQKEEDIPTMEDFYNALMEVPPTTLDMGQTYELQKTVERYTQRGTDILFSEKTNIDLKNRFVVFDLVGLGDNLKELAMLVILEYIYQRACANAKQKKITILDIDEVHLFFKSELVSQYFSKIWKVGRHILLYTCGITQNVTNLLNSESGRDMIKNTAFVQLLKQHPQDAIRFGELLNLSKTELDYCHNSQPGHGLLSIAASQEYPVTSVIPFKNIISKESPIYKLISTKIIRDEI